MASSTKAKAGPRKKGQRKVKRAPLTGAILSARRWVWRLALWSVLLVTGWVAIYSFVNPPVTPYMLGEYRKYGPLERTWASYDEISPVMARSVVAAEDANFCLHWGFDMDAIRQVLEKGQRRGASTISQQVVKNVFLWHGRSYVRKALEALLTPAVELFWSKRRIVEVYMNVAEFDQGVFGVEAAARHYFGVGADRLTDRQAALLAALLPNPKNRSASNPSDFVSRRAVSITSGAETIRRDGRADCFED